MGDGGREFWDRQWESNLARFSSSGNPMDLVPANLLQAKPLRVDGLIATGLPAEHEFLHGMFLKRRAWKRYFQEPAVIYDIGCGPGYTTFFLAEMFPDAEVFGLDFSPTAVSLVEMVGERLKVKVRGRFFDMKAPSLEAERGAAFFTSGAMEQLGWEWGPMFRWLSEQQPAVVLHSEPFFELYDGTAFDAEAALLHRQHGYLEGYLPFLQAHPGVELLKVERVRFGSWHDAYSQVAWRPK